MDLICSIIWTSEARTLWRCPGFMLFKDCRQAECHIRRNSSRPHFVLSHELSWPRARRSIRTDQDSLRASRKTFLLDMAERGPPDTCRLDL